jgi:two-component system, LytTR family, response regulator
MKIRCLVIDDEPYAVNLLSEYIGQLPNLSLEKKCYNALEALEFLRSHKADLIFLDINMPQLTGMELVNLFTPGQRFIFTTAYAEYAAESYEKNAVDYLVKPITFDRFFKAINKAQALIQQPMAHAPVDQVIFLKTGRSIVQLRYPDILFIEAMKDYVVFHTAQARHMAYKRMKDLEETLPPSFSRVHNSFIINRDHMQRVEENHVFIDTHRIPVSEKYREAFLQLLNNRLL